MKKTRRAGNLANHSDRRRAISIVVHGLHRHVGNKLPLRANNRRHSNETGHKTSTVNFNQGSRLRSHLLVVGIACVFTHLIPAQPEVVNVIIVAD